MLLTFIATISALFAFNESEFIDTSKKQMAEGYEWTRLESCRPSQNDPSIKLDNDLVCFALEKPLDK
jgi:hypothetical protein